MKNNYEALISAMESLALTQFERAFNDEEEKNNENINKNLCFNYYLLGVQQEYLKRKNDSINSFASAKLYIPQSGKNKNNNEYNFIKIIMNLILLKRYIYQKAMRILALLISEKV